MYDRIFNCPNFRATILEFLFIKKPANKFYMSENKGYLSRHERRQDHKVYGRPQAYF